MATTYYVLFCVIENSDNPNPIEKIFLTLEDAQAQMALCVATCVSECTAAYPGATVLSQISNDGLASIIKYQSTMTVTVDINGVECPGLELSYTNQMLYSRMYITQSN